MPESQKCVHSSVGSAEGEPSYYDIYQNTNREVANPQGLCRPSSDTLRTYETHASASMEEHRWSVSDIGRASDVAIPRDSGAERGSPITCPADVTARGERYEIINNRNSTLPSESSVNAGWGPPLSAITLPNSYMPADNSTADHTADAWYSMRWATEPYS